MQNQRHTNCQARARSTSKPKDVPNCINYSFLATHPEHRLHHRLNRFTVAWIRKKKHTLVRGDDAGGVWQLQKFEYLLQYASKPVPIGRRSLFLGGSSYGLARIMLNRL